MTSDACKTITGVAFVLKKEGKVLLHRRNVKGKIAYGSFALPGGTVEHDETVKRTVCREAAEELGIIIDEKDVAITHIHRLREKYDAATGQTQLILLLYFAEIHRWAGEPQNLEPHKHSELAWFKMNELPSDLFHTDEQGLRYIDQGIFYSEQGWE